MAERPPLRERKQQRAREHIVEAAYALFAERGFGDVTVTDIAERAEVGRTTFFRYFGDKQEVVFADEQQLLEQLTDRGRTLPEEAPTTLREALDQFREIVLELCSAATADTARYELHQRLVSQNPELSDRSVRKLQRFAELGEAVLLERGVPREIAVLAPQLAVACYHTGNRLAGAEAATLGPAVDVAFGRISALLDGEPAHGQGSKHGRKKVRDQATMERSEP